MFSLLVGGPGGRASRWGGRAGGCVGRFVGGRVAGQAGERAGGQARAGGRAGGGTAINDETPWALMGHGPNGP